MQRMGVRLQWTCYNDLLIPYVEWYCYYQIIRLSKERSQVRVYACAINQFRAALWPDRNYIARKHVVLIADTDCNYRGAASGGFFGLNEWIND